MNTDTQHVPEHDPEHDPEIIARLRSALDEVAAAPLASAPAGSMPPGRKSSEHGTWSAGRWIAVAASVALVAGAVAVIAANLSNRQPVQSGATTVPASTVAVPAEDDAMHYFLAAADLAPGEVTSLPACCLQPDEVAMAWALDGDPANGLLVMRAAPTDPEVSPATTPTATVITIGGTSMAIDSYGLTAVERDALASALMPGSGLPWVLPVEGWSVIALQSPSDSPAHSQLFGGRVAVTAGVSAEAFFTFASATTVSATTVAGNPGWVLEYIDGATLVLWRHPQSGEWMQLDVPADLADRTDALVAAIVPTTDSNTTPVTMAPPTVEGGHQADLTAVSGDPLTTFDSSLTLDPAVGTPAPAFTTTDGPFTVDSPTLLLFAAHWCPHCNAEIPRVLAALEAGQLRGARVVLVSTADAGAAANFPPTAWLQGLGWTEEVVFDISPGDGSAGQLATAFGAPGWPYAVMLNADGLVTARAVGEMTADQLAALAATA
ncbi:MAG: TlpA disulfide reductase family protein [Actinomycetota bacterium]|nr:TlpA disulfide reductase family protein [Actinomycetota bacterium]